MTVVVVVVNRQQPILKVSLCIVVTAVIVVQPCLSV